MGLSQCKGRLVAVKIPRRKKKPKTIQVCISSELKFPCNILVKYISLFSRIPENKLLVLRSCSKGDLSHSLAKTYTYLVNKLCEGIEIEGDRIRVQAWNLEALLENAGNYRIAEFIVYALAMEGILSVEYWGAIGKKIPVKHRKAWRGVSGVPQNPREAALKLLWYLITTRSEALREKRGRAWRPHIKVWTIKIDKLCKTGKVSRASQAS